MRTSYNIAGTTTGRLSSSFSEFGTGTNLQNIEESLRSVFVADPGMKMAYLDAEQGESRVVGAIEGNLFQDWKYLDACEGGDLHTTVARLVWPDLPWPRDPLAQRKLAEVPYYRHYDRRFMCKKIGHGTNYGGKPRTLASQAKVEQSLIEDFQPKYFAAFPAHLRWHAWVEHQLRESGHLITLTGRKRWFFGRRTDDSTLREAIAYDPQGSLADILNRGMLEVWRARNCELLMQIHDAILVQYPESREDEVLPLIQSRLRVPITLEGGRDFTIPYGVATGWNWGKYDAETNPDGLRAYAPGDKRRRTPEVSILDRSFRRLHRQPRVSAAISVLAAALEQKVWITTSDRLYPNLYTILVGHPGVGKTRTIMSGRKFLAELPEFHIAPTSMKMASLVDALLASKRMIIQLPNPAIEYNSMTLLCDDWQAFMHAYDDELVAGLTTFYDVTVPYEHWRRGKNIEIVIKRPQLSILAGTTPSDLMENIPVRAWGGGLTSRMIMVYSNERITGDDFAVIRRDLPEDMLHDIKVIYSLQGEFEVSQEFQAAVAAWRAQGETPKPSHPKLVHYNTRRRAHLYKLSMVSAINRGNDLTLRQEDFRSALGWLSEAELAMPHIFEEGATSLDARAMDEILDFVRRQGKPIPHHRLVHETAKRVPTHAVLKVIEVMWLSGRLKKSEDNLYLANDPAADR